MYFVPMKVRYEPSRAIRAHGRHDKPGARSSGAGSLPACGLFRPGSETIIVQMRGAQIDKKAAFRQITYKTFQADWNAKRRIWAAAHGDSDTARRDLAPDAP
jgi:hypothetical protein